MNFEQVQSAQIWHQYSRATDIRFSFTCTVCNHPRELLSRSKIRCTWIYSFSGQRPRSCPGEALATTELFLFFSNIFQSFEIAGDKAQMHPGTRDMTLGLLNTPLPFNIRLLPRQWQYSYSTTVYARAFHLMKKNFVSHPFKYKRNVSRHGNQFRWTTWLHQEEITVCFAHKYTSL